MIYQEDLEKAIAQRKQNKKFLIKLEKNWMKNSLMHCFMKIKEHEGVS